MDAGVPESQIKGSEQYQIEREFERKSESMEERQARIDQIITNS
jgi:hypothetical protein